MFIGCHISIAGGIQRAPQRAADFGCEAMQIFTRSPQGGKTPELSAEIIADFKLQTKTYSLKTVVVHSPYYINLASTNNRIRYGSVKAIREELDRASAIGAKYVMTHLGSAKDMDKNEALGKVCEMLKKSLDGYRGSAKLLLENSAGAGAIIGSDLADLSTIIKCVKNKSIAGICLDTQHSFASGYDWNDFENTIAKIDKEIGIKNIKLFHANDSLTELGSKKDRHEHLGKGLIGKKAFADIVKFAQKNNIDMICETEYEGVKEDIELLKKLRNDL